MKKGLIISGLVGAGLLASGFAYAKKRTSSTSGGNNGESSITTVASLKLPNGKTLNKNQTVVSNQSSGVPLVRTPSQIASVDAEFRPTTGQMVGIFTGRIGVDQKHFQEDNTFIQIMNDGELYWALSAHVTTV